jgi:hypothetical protein
MTLCPILSPPDLCDVDLWLEPSSLQDLLSSSAFGDAVLSLVNPERGAAAPVRGTLPKTRLQPRA